MVSLELFVECMCMWVAAGDLECAVVFIVQSAWSWHVDLVDHGECLNTCSLTWSMSSRGTNVVSWDSIGHSPRHEATVYMYYLYTSCM